MTELRESLATLLSTEWTLDDDAVFVSSKAPMPLDGEKPLIRVYQVASPAVPRGLGYTHRQVQHRLTVDIRSRKQANADAAKDEVLRILGSKRIQPWSSYDYLEYDDGSDRGGGTGLAVWTVEVTVHQLRKSI